MEWRGLLNGQFDADPEKNAQIKRGLLDFGLNMLAQGGKPTGQAFGNAGLLTQQARQQREQQAQQAKRSGVQDQLMQGQLNDQQHRQRMQQLPGQFMQKPVSMDNRDVGMPGEQRPQFDAQGYAQALMGHDPMAGLQFQQATKKQEPALQEIDPTKTYGTWQNGTFTPAISGKQKEAEQPSAVREYEYAKGQGYRGTFEQFQLSQRRAGATNVTTYGTGSAPMQMPDGSINLVQLSGKPGAAPQIVRDPTTGTPLRPPPQDRDIRMTEAQAKAATFKSQMEFAERELSSVPIDQTKIYSQIDTVMAGGMTNPIASANAQRARQAQEQWSEAFLRFKTGAATTKDEVKANVRTFFPQPGDSPAVIEQKKRARGQAAKDLTFAAGQAKAGAAPEAAPAGGLTHQEQTELDALRKRFGK